MEVGVGARIQAVRGAAAFHAQLQGAALLGRFSGESRPHAEGQTQRSGPCHQFAAVHD